MTTESATRRLIPWARPPPFGRAWLVGATSWMRARLAKSRTTWELAALAMVVLLPTLWSGLAVDDFFHRLAVEGKLGFSAGRLDLFDFISPNPDQRAHFKELGVYPWWIGAHTQVSYWRPLAAWTHFVDYALWPRAAWLMHAENLVWYGALVVAAGKLYWRFIAVPWVAGLATACYAFDHAHAYPAAWVANRNALMSVLFGVLAVLAHRRWRMARRGFDGALACGAYALALLSAESGLAITGYLMAYAMVFESGNRARALSLLPYGFIIAVWRVVYRAFGHGAFGSGANVDPLVNPGLFVVHALRTGPLLLASDILVAPPELLLRYPDWFAAATLASVGILVVIGFAIRRLVRRDPSSGPSMSFFALGAALSVVPLSGTFPSDRYLFWAGLGIMGVVAQLAGVLFGEKAWQGSRLVCVVGAACLFLRAVVSPLAFPFRAAGPGLMEDDYERMVETIPRGPGFAHATVLVLNAPLDLLGMGIPIVAMAKGEASPAHMYTLFAGRSDVTVSRVGPRAVEVSSPRGWFARSADRLFRDAPLAAGETIALDAMTARVESLTGDGRPDRVRFTFPADLDDPSLVFLTWGRHGFDRVVPPRAATELTVPAAPFLVADVLQPHIRQRAVESGQLF